MQQMSRTRTRRYEITAEEYQQSASEDDIESTLRDLVDHRGGRLFHVRDARSSPEMVDMPDHLILIPGLVAVLELKSMHRALTNGQEEVSRLMASAERFIAGVVRPVPRMGEYGFDDVLDILRRS